MARFFWVFLAALMLLVVGLAPAADEAAPAGNWKVKLLFPDQEPVLWLIRLEPQDGKWTGKLLGRVETKQENFPKVTAVDEVALKGDELRFSLRYRRGAFTFEGKLSKGDVKKIPGSMTLGEELVLAQLEPTKLDSLEPYELTRETLAQATAAPEIIDKATALLEMAGRKKAKPGEVRSWADKAFRAAEPFGLRMQRDVAVRVASGLLDSDTLAPVALEYARRAERLLTPSDKRKTQEQVLTLLAAALQKADKADEAKEVTARIDKLYRFAGRKAKSDRAVLVELFTGAECPPCVAADIAFDSLGRAYKPSEVVLLQYHLNIPRPDPMANPDTEARQEYYGAEGTPVILFNGKAGPEEGGSRADAPDKYDEYNEIVKPLLETPAPLKLKVNAVKKGDKVEITATASDVADPGERVRLRLALVEDQVDYRGGNRLPHHRRVVRALPGGVKGVSLTEATGTQKVVVDLEKLRKDWTKYLEGVEDMPKDRPLDFKKLSVVAFVQNDKTKEVLQAAQAEVGGGESQ